MTVCGSHSISLSHQHDQSLTIGRQSIPTRKIPILPASTFLIASTISARRSNAKATSLFSHTAGDQISGTLSHYSPLPLRHSECRISNTKFRIPACPGPTSRSSTSAVTGKRSKHGQTPAGLSLEKSTQYRIPFSSRTIMGAHQLRLRARQS